MPTANGHIRGKLGKSTRLIQSSPGSSGDRPLGWWIVDIGWVWRKQIGMDVQYGIENSMKHASAWKYLDLDIECCRAPSKVWTSAYMLLM